MPKENPKLLQNKLDEAPSVETFASDFYTRNKKDIDKWIELAKARLEEWTHIDDVGLLDEYNTCKLFKSPILLGNDVSLL